MAFSSFNSFQTFLMYVRAKVSNLSTFTYNFPALDPSLVLYYPLDSSANPSNGFQTANFASRLPVYDASLAGSAIISYAPSNTITSFGDLSLNNTMGSQLVVNTPGNNYVVANNTFALNISGGFSISLWFSCSGQLNKTGTLISLPYQKTGKGIEIDISGTNMIYTGWTPPATSSTISYSLSAANLSGLTYNQISVTDYGNVAIATTTGIYYGNAEANFVFSKSITGINITSISINNYGKGLACSTSTLYSSSNYGATWTATAIQPNAANAELYQQVIVTQTGLSYVLTGKTTASTTNCSNIFNSSDNFNTTNTNMLLNSFTPYGNLDMRNRSTNPNGYNSGSDIYNGCMSFASNGCGIVCGNFGTYKAFMYYNSKSPGWSSPASGYTTRAGGGVSISDNGKYIVMFSLNDRNTDGSNTVYVSYATVVNSDFTLTQIPDSNVNNGNISATNKFYNVPYYIVNNGFYSNVTVDNFGNAYFSKSANNGVYTTYNFFTTTVPANFFTTVQTLGSGTYKPFTNTNNNFTTIVLSSNGNYTATLDSSLNQVIYNVQTNTNIQLSNGLVLYWPFETTLNETINNQAPTTLYGTPSISNSVVAVGTGSFDGTVTQKYALYTNPNGILPIGSGYTISMWWYPPTQTSNYPQVFTFTDNSTSFSNQIACTFDNTNFYLYLLNGGASVFNSGGALICKNVTFNTWNHIVFSFPTDVSGTGVFVDHWLNGINYRLTDYIARPVPTIQRNAAFINGITFAGTNYICYGYLDDVRVYNRQINSLEVQTLYNLSNSHLYPIDALSTTTRTAMLSPTTITNGGACAFALKLLYSGYTGPIIRIQRSTDSAVSDFYADNSGKLGTAYLGTGTSFSTWLTAAGGTPIAYILKWYDQTGNGNDASGNYTGTPINYPTLSNSTITNINSNTTPPTGYYVSLNAATNANNSNWSYFTLPNGALPYGNCNYSYVIKMYIHNNDGYYRPIIGGGDVNGGAKNYTGIRMDDTAGVPAYNHLWYNNDQVIQNTPDSNHKNEVATFTYSGATKYIYVTQGTTTNSYTQAISGRIQSNTNNTIGTNAGFSSNANGIVGSSKMYSICVLPYDLQSNITDRKILEAI